MFVKFDKVGKTTSEIVGHVFGSTCPLCGRIATNFCKRCQAVLDARNLTEIVDSSRRYNGEVLVAFEYDETIRKIIVNFKYRNQRSSLRFLGDAVVDRIASEKKFAAQRIDLVTWAPTTPSRLATRGFDQAELVARYVAKEMQLPCKKVLTRLSTHFQTGRSRTARLEGTLFSSRELDAEHLLLVDDVVTTGATLNSASKALYQAGAGLVSCVAVASTVLWQSSIGSYARARARK